MYVGLYRCRSYQIKRFISSYKTWRPKGSKIHLFFFDLFVGPIFRSTVVLKKIIAFQCVMAFAETLCATLYFGELHSCRVLVDKKIYHKKIKMGWLKKLGFQGIWTSRRTQISLFLKGKIVGFNYFFSFGGLKTAHFWAKSWSILKVSLYKIQKKILQPTNFGYQEMEKKIISVRFFCQEKIIFVVDTSLALLKEVFMPTQFYRCKLHLNIR